MIKSLAGRELDAWVQRLFPFVFWGRIHPHVLTVAGAVVSTAAALALASGALLLGAGLILFGGFFDLVDGVVARRRGISTRFGAFLDSTLDRWVDGVLLVGLAVHFARAGEPGHVALAGIALTLAFLVSYAKACAERVLARLEAGWMERGERIGVLALGCALGFPVVALWIIAAGSAVSFVQRLIAAHRELQRLDASEESA